MAVTASAPPGAGPDDAPKRRQVDRSRPAADHVVLAAIGAVAALFLATRLGLIWRLPPGWDESGYGEWAQGAAQSASTRWLSMLEGKEPLTSWLGALWVHLGAQYLTAVRLVSLVAGAVSLSMLWLVGRRLGVRVALAAMALYALLPLFVVHDSTGLMEPVVTAASLCVLYLTIRVAERPAIDVALLLGLAAGAGLLTKESGQFALAMVPLGLLAFDWRGPRVAARLARWVGAIAVAAATCAACWAILLLSPNWETYKHARDQFHRPLGDVLGDPWKPISANGGDLFPALWSYVGPALVALAVVGMVLAVLRRRRLSLLVALWGALPFLGSLLLVATGGYPRYWVPAIAPLCLTAAQGLFWVIGLVARRVARGTPRHAATAVIVALVAVPPGILLARVLATPGTAHYPGLDDTMITSWAAGTGWKDVARQLDARTQGAAFTIAYDRARPLWIYLHDAKRAQQIPRGTPPAAGAQYLVRNYDPLTSAERANFRLLRSFPRPRHGSPIELYVHR